MEDLKEFRLSIAKVEQASGMGMGVEGEDNVKISIRIY